MISAPKQPWRIVKRADTFDGMMRAAWIIGLCWTTGPVLAQHDMQNEAQEFWSRLTISYQYSSAWRHDAEFQFRDQQVNKQVDDRFNLYTFRYYANYRKDRFFLQLSPFTYFFRTTGETTVKEFRLVQLVGWHFLQEKLQLRTGLEQRFFNAEGSRFEELRFRTRLLFRWPIFPMADLNLSDEIFLHDRLSGDEVDVLDQNRVNVSVTVRPFPQWSIEPGYSFQTRQLPDGRNNFHVLYINLMLQTTRPALKKNSAALM